ncbi:MAG: MarR family transcriptional regulator [Gemmatimonadota bacterium]|nr:MarR family transcriptional regulator [Gemmatimonadota bacterium]
MPTPKPLQFVSPLHKATRQIGEFMEADSRARGVEPSEGHLLSYTTLYGPCPVSQLTRVFGHKPSTLTGMLDRLEEKGLLAREPNPDDRRSTLVRVTDEGGQVATELRDMLERLEDGVQQRIDARDLEGFQKVMAAIADLTRPDPDHPETA